MAKARVGAVLRESMGSKSSNRSNDLDRLTKNYFVWCKTIATLIDAIKKHLKCLQQIAVSRATVAKCFGMFSKETPLFDCTGLLPSEDRPANTVCSYSSVHEDLSAKIKNFCGKYQQHVLDYAVEWEKTVRNRIDNGLKKAEEYLKDLDHYQKKVESLRLQTNQSMAKGKSVASGTQEKLSRNEEKLINSKQNYNKVATDLVILMEEVTERSWRDLHPLLLKCAQFDRKLASDEAEALDVLKRIEQSLMTIANEKGISPHNRLKDLGSLKPELVSTRPGGVAGLQIEYSGSNGSGTSVGAAPILSGGYTGETALAPGAVGPQGLGGFPVQLAGTTNTHDPFAPNNLSNGMNMLALTTTTPTNQSSTPSYMQQYNPPPASTSPFASAYEQLPPPSYGGSNWSSNNQQQMSTYTTGGSFNEADSAYNGYSGYSAPSAISAPPSFGMPPVPPPLPPTSHQSYGYAPPPLSTGVVRSNSLDPYSPANSASFGGSGMTSPSYATTPGTTNPSPWSSSISNPSPMYSPPPLPQQPPPPSFTPSQMPPTSNQGYNPFG